MSDDEEVKGNKRLSSPSGDEPESKKKVSSTSAENDWNVDECRGDHESEEHWELRKQFLVQNMGRYNKPRLICLSQVFANMEFLGCRYPEETMELVHELSLGIVEDYREKQKTRLQRTFVKASDAAERKTKGSSSANRAVTVRGEQICKSTASSPHPPPSGIVQLPRTSLPLSHNSSFPEAFDDLNNVVLIIYAYNAGENVVQIIHRSCSAAKIPISMEFDGLIGNYTCTYHIGRNLLISSNDGHPTKDVAKSQAAQFVFSELQKHCYIFVTKLRSMPEFDGKEVAKNDVDKSENSERTTIPQGISDDNIGNKLLKLMGWSGGGLGKNQQGIQEAISVDGVVGKSRLGLGNASGGAFHTKIKTLLEEQKRVGFTHDLKFSSDFSKDERKDIHMIAQRLGLKSKSYGKDEDRYLVVSEKTSRLDLINTTLANGGDTEKYRVIPPGGSLEGIEHLICSDQL